MGDSCLNSKALIRRNLSFSRVSHFSSSSWRILPLVSLSLHLLQASLLHCRYLIRFAQFSWRLICFSLFFVAWFGMKHWDCLLLLLICKVVVSIWVLYFNYKFSRALVWNLNSIWMWSCNFVVPLAIRLIIPFLYSLLKNLEHCS